MKKLLLAFLLIYSLASAQVGIGTLSPNGSLDIVSANDGFIAPRIALTSSTDNTTVQTLTEAELIYNTATVSDVIPGFYYWDGAKWVRVGSGTSNSWELLGNSGTNPSTNFIGTTDAQDLVFRTNNTENLRIDNNNGNILVGGTYPSARLFLNTPSSNTTNNYGVRSILESNLGTLGSYSGYFVNNTNTSGWKYGLRSNISSAGAGRRYGGYFQTYGPNVNHSSQVTGILNEVFMGNSTASGTTSHFGIKNTLSLSGGDHTTSGDFIGFDNTIYGSGNVNNANAFGIFNEIDVQGNGDRYGVFTSFPIDENTGSGNKHGYFSYIHPSAGGIHYGLYSQVLKANSFAGYFLGRVSIGTAAGNEYILPSTRGTNGQIMVTDATGNVTWANPSSGASDADWYIENTTTSPTNISNNIFTNGNVGIGDNTPDANLDIASTGDAKIIIEADTGNGAEDNNPEIQLIQDGGVVTASIQLEGNPGTVAAETGENELLIRTTHASSDIQILPTDNLTTTFKSSGQVQLNEYTTATTFTGTATSLLAVDNTGNIIQQPLTTGTDWSITGNTGTTAGTNFLGTTDAQDLSIRTNNVETLRIKTFGTIYTPSTFRNTALGDFALGQTQTGTNTYNTAMGYAAGFPITSGTRNTLMGSFSGRNMTTARRNTAIGYYSLFSLTTGQQNVAIGRNALRDITTASNNVAIGDQSLEKLGTFNGRNVAVGRFTASDMVNGNYNTILGFQSGVYMDNAEYNIGIGAFSMGSTRSGGVATGSSEQNIGIGTSSLSEIDSGSHNIAMGEQSLHVTSSGSNNLSIGNRSGNLLTTGSNNMFLGSFAGDLLTTESNLLYIENTSTNTPLIGGNFSTNRVGINTNATTGLTHTLTVGGDVKAVDFEATASGTIYADYVFEDYFGKEATINKDYKFTPLSEAINFVKENGHLPNVKSFSEVKANNFEISLTETSLKNLEKIEENFLYISELNQKLENSEKENEALKNRIEKLEALVSKLIEEKK